MGSLKGNRMFKIAWLLKDDPSPCEAGLIPTGISEKHAMGKQLHGKTVDYMKKGNLE